MTAPLLSAIISLMKNTGIGAVFTPRKWAGWLLQNYSICEKWLSGAVIADPSSGRGDFLLTLVQQALEKGISREKLPLERLLGVEKEDCHIKDFFKRFSKEFNMDFPAANIYHADVILDPLDFKVDILMGNPPWQNFADLPLEYKAQVKQSFLKAGLVSNKKRLLLGSSRIDLAALVVSKCINDYLSEQGEAYFFLPLSLFLNEGAHQAFRMGKIPCGNFALKEIYDFAADKIFKGVETRFGMASFKKGAKVQFPIPYFIKEGEDWKKRQALPLHSSGSALSVFPKECDVQRLLDFKIKLPKTQKARQGVNSCGAARWMIFHSVEKLDKDMLLVMRKDGEKFKLPAAFLFPLLDKTQFDFPDSPPVKYILLAYDRNSGKVLKPHQISEEKHLASYLQLISEQLQARKGVLIRNFIQRGEYWACLGAGKYCFAPYKLLWQAFGSREFKPCIFSDYQGQPWQGNQAMHAYIPCYDLKQAQILLKKFQSPEVREYLASFRMQGTKSWAQPGQINKLLDFQEEDYQAGLFPELPFMSI